jgi:hypothetical protein
MFAGYRPRNESLAKHLGGDAKRLRRADELCDKENAPDVNARAIEVQCRLKTLRARRV